MNINLTPLQEDFLTELMNIAMGLAASSMSEMIDDEIRLSVPNIEFISRHDVVTKFFNQVDSELAGVSQKITGALAGELLLLFPSNKSLTVVEMMMQDRVSLEGMAELEQEALCEIGNILLNAVVSSLADNINESFECSLPTYVCGNSRHIIPDRMTEEDVVLLLHVDFCFTKESVDGYVIILLNVDSIDMLLKKIDSRIEKMR